METFIINGINVFIIFFAIGYFGSEKINTFLENRKERIRHSMKRAQSRKEQALISRSDYENRIRDFENERQIILESARKRAAQTRAELLEEGKKEADRIRERAEREALLSRARIENEVKVEMITEAFRLAEERLRKDADDTRQSDWIRKTLEEMSEATWQN